MVYQGAVLLYWEGPDDQFHFIGMVRHPFPKTSRPRFGESVDLSFSRGALLLLVGSPGFEYDLSNPQSDVINGVVRTPSCAPCKALAFN